jgi:23S rRNA pseudouridine1911/1915/1917 synthase
VNKPPGLLVVPLHRRKDARTVYEDLQEHLQSHGRSRPFVVHRIDRDTSGLVLFAKSRDAQHQLKEQFARREPERAYLAVVHGHPKPESGTWSDRLVWEQDDLIQRAASARDARAKDAVSAYRVVERFRHASLIEVRLVTGKRNQIRVQAGLRGHRLVGERYYIEGPAISRPIEFPRQALHAWRLAFRHPEDGRDVGFEAPLPVDMAELLKRLRR